jgi:tight adherence protein C
MSPVVVAALAAVALLAAGSALRPAARRAAAPQGDVDAPTAAPGQSVRRLRRRTARADIDRVVPEAIELVVLAVRAGHLPAAAVEAVLPHLPPPVQPAFAEVAERCASGERFADALTALVQHLGPVAAPLADSFAAADRYGLPLAPVLERLAAEARHHRRRRADALARQLPVRLAIPLVLCTLPSFVLLAIVPLLLAALSSLH